MGYASSCFLVTQTMAEAFDSTQMYPDVPRHPIAVRFRMVSASQPNARLLVFSCDRRSRNLAHRGMVGVPIICDML